MRQRSSSLMTHQVCSGLESPNPDLHESWPFLVVKRDEQLAKTCLESLTDVFPKESTVLSAMGQLHVGWSTWRETAPNGCVARPAWTCGVSTHHPSRTFGDPGVQLQFKRVHDCGGRRPERTEQFPSLLSPESDGDAGRTCLNDEWDQDAEVMQTKP